MTVKNIEQLLNRGPEMSTNLNQGPSITLFSNHHSINLKGFYLVEEADLSLYKIFSSQQFE